MSQIVNVVLKLENANLLITNPLLMLFAAFAEDFVANSEREIAINFANTIKM